ncbi:putative peroxygenase 3 [Podospora australis]|uniref:Peroxygenase 3 n=1 Tax=Podospora australis TaxID=1536484 RepID=A0AAN6WHT2_9PEZI|nr:putative peroxygenase 3 [Podospora australis]
MGSNPAQVKHESADHLASLQPNFDTAASRAPQTLARPQSLTGAAALQKPSVARANQAVSVEQPDGSLESHTAAWKQYTVLQQHILFWDRNNDGIISPWDTYVGFRDLGFSILFSALAMVIINANFSYPTRLAYSYIPDPFFRVYVGGIHKAKHGSDSGVYDKEGRFVPQAFEDLFSKWDKDDKKELTGWQLWRMVGGHRNAVDPFGWFAAFFEFGTAFLLLQKNGRVSKEDLRQTYDGTIFWRIKEARESGVPGWDKGFGLWGFGLFVVSQFERFLNVLFTWSGAKKL